MVEPRQLQLYPKVEQPLPRQEEVLLDGQYSADIPPSEREFLNRLAVGSLVDVKWQKIRHSMSSCRCHDVMITRTTAASVWIDGERFDRQTSEASATDAVEGLRICSPQYQFMGGVEEVEQEQLPWRTSADPDELPSDELAIDEALLAELDAGSASVAEGHDDAE